MVSYTGMWSSWPRAERSSSSGSLVSIVSLALATHQASVPALCGALPLLSPSTPSVFLEICSAAREAQEYHRERSQSILCAQQVTDLPLRRGQPQESKRDREHSSLLLGLPHHPALPVSCRPPTSKATRSHKGRYLRPQVTLGHMIGLLKGRCHGISPPAQPIQIPQSSNTELGLVGE